MCSCTEYEDLEFRREAISERIKKSRNLKKSLQLVAKHPDGEHKLLICSVCSQFWQSSRAWNWGNDEYVFKVPSIDFGEWASDVFVQPDELLIFVAVVGNFLKSNSFVAGGAKCSVSACESTAIKGFTTCMLHHFESLQKIRTMPKYPDGRWFGPYVRENIIPAL